MGPVSPHYFRMVGGMAAMASTADVFAGQCDQALKSCPKSNKSPNLVTLSLDRPRWIFFVWHLQDYPHLPFVLIWKKYVCIKSNHPDYFPWKKDETIGLSNWFFSNSHGLLQLQSPRQVIKLFLMFSTFLGSAILYERDARFVLYFDF